jgi:hypothetical protein
MRDRKMDSGERAAAALTPRQCRCCGRPTMARALLIETGEMVPACPECGLKLHEAAKGKAAP